MNGALKATHFLYTPKSLRRLALLLSEAKWPLFKGTTTGTRFSSSSWLVISKANLQQQEPQQHDEQHEELFIQFMISHSKRAIDSRRNM
jgi:uncharacterized protein (DUF305 family)